MRAAGGADGQGPVDVHAELAATAERANRAEVQLRNAHAAVVRMADQIEQLQHELSDTRCSLAKCQEEGAAAISLAGNLGARAADQEHQLMALRERVDDLEQQVAGRVAQESRLRAELAAANQLADEATAARNLLASQLDEAVKQQARSAAAAAAAEEQYRADLQQLQVRLAASEAECRALQHAKGAMHDELHHVRGENLALQGQLQDELRQREELASDNRRLHRELEGALEALAQAQRAQRTTAAGAQDLEAEVERLRSARSGLEAELAASEHRTQRLQEENQQLTERNTELVTQLHGFSATVRLLEVENARLTDGHATLRVEAEARAAEVRAARGEAAELAADRARLVAELQAARPEGPSEEVDRLHKALQDSRSEVTRLQKEVAANDAVLAEAEAALVALVREKEGLAQQLDAARAAGRLAAEGERVAREQAAQLRAQLEAAAQQASSLAPAEGEGTGAAAQSAADERMTTYLQSLVTQGLAAPPSDGGTDPVAAAQPPSILGAGSDSDTTQAAIPVPAVIVPALARAQPHSSGRYAIGTRTSESGSAQSAYPPAGTNPEGWEAASTSGWDTSAGGSIGGAGPAAATVCLFPEVVAGRDRDLLGPELPPPSVASGQAATEQAAPDTAVYLAQDQQEPAAEDQAAAAPPGAVVEAGGLDQDYGPALDMLRPASSGPPSSAAADGSAVATVLSAATHEPKVPLAASLLVGGIAGAGGVGGAGTRDEAVYWLHANAQPPSYTIVSTVADATRANGSPNHQQKREGPADRQSPRPPLPASLGHLDAAWAAEETTPYPGGLHRDLSHHAVAQHDDAVAASLSALPATPGLQSPRPHPAAEALALPSETTVGNAAVEDLDIFGTPAAARALISTPEVSTPRAVGQGLDALAAVPKGLTTPAAAAAAAPDQGSMLEQQATPQRVSATLLSRGLVRSEAPSTKSAAPATEAENREVIRPRGTSSPMISPRVLLEARILSRAVRPSAEALSSCLRPSLTVAAMSGSTKGEQADPGSVAAPEAPAPDLGRVDAKPLVSARTLPLVQALASQQVLRHHHHQQQEQQQQQHFPQQTTPLAASARSLGPVDLLSADAGAFSTPAASAIATAAASNLVVGGPLATYATPSVTAAAAVGPMVPASSPVSSTPSSSHAAAEVASPAVHPPAVGVTASVTGVAAAVSPMVSTPPQAFLSSPSAHAEAGMSLAQLAKRLSTDHVPAAATITPPLVSSVSASSLGSSLRSATHPASYTRQPVGPGGPDTAPEAEAEAASTRDQPQASVPEPAAEPWATHPELQLAPSLLGAAYLGGRGSERSVSDEDAVLAQRLAAMDEALRFIGAV